MRDQIVMYFSVPVYIYKKYRIYDIFQALPVFFFFKSLCKFKEQYQMVSHDLTNPMNSHFH